MWFLNPLIAILYLWISGWLFYLWTIKRNSFILFLFILFVLFSAGSRLYGPAHWLFASIDLIIALAIAISLPKTILYVQTLPSIQELINMNHVAQEELTKRELLEAEHLQLINSLSHSVELLELQLKQNRWMDRKSENIEKIKKLLLEAL